ncbi:MAG: permease [Gemmataceae bacterium]
MDVKDFIILFMSVFFEAMPFIVVGALISGVLEELVPQEMMARIIPRNRLLAISMGALLGLVFPMCECGIVPIMRRLLRKGVPLSTGVAYMLAGPIINVVVFGSTWVAFRKYGDQGGYYIVAFRMILGFLVAVGTALVVDWYDRKKGSAALLTLSALPPPIPEKTMSLSASGEKMDLSPAPRKSPLQRLSNISESALHDFIDISVFVVLGAILASLSRMLIGTDKIAQWSVQYPPVAILAMMALAVFMCICSEADAFIAASYTTMHPSAKIAFLVFGPMFDFKLLLMFTRVYRPKLIRVIVISLVVQVFLYTLILHYVWGPAGWPLPTQLRYVKP